MHADGRKRQVGKIKCPDFLQFFAASLVCLKFPPARNALTFPQILDNFLDGFLGNAHLLSNLRTNPIKFGWYCQFQVTSLNLSNLFRCWHKRCRRRNLLSFRFGWSWRLRHFGLCGFASLFTARLIAFRTGLTTHTWSWPATIPTLH